MEDAIIITLGAMCSALIGLIIRYSYRSKCEDVNFCWGFLKFHRDVKSEKEIITEDNNDDEIKQT